MGPEAIQYFKEKDLQELIKRHLEAAESDIDRVEGIGAINFLALDDIAIEKEGEAPDPSSIIQIEFENDRARFPSIERSTRDEFLQRLQRSGKKWVILVDDAQNPHLVVDTDSFIRDALFGAGLFNPHVHCHRPIVVRDAPATLGDTILRLKVNPTHMGDDVVDEDIILFWGRTRRVITGADILGRLLRGIVQQEKVRFSKVTSP